MSYIAIGLESVATIRLEAIASRLEAIVIRLEAIASEFFPTAAQFGRHRKQGSETASFSLPRTNMEAENSPLQILAQFSSTGGFLVPY